MTGLNEFTAAMPEIFVAIAGMALLMVGVFRKRDATDLVSWAAVGVFAVTAIMVMDVGSDRIVAFNGLFVVDAFAVFLKILILLGSAAAIILSLNYLHQEQLARFEYPVLMVFAVLGMMMMVSANDLLALYVGLELSSLSLYVLAAFRRDSVKSSEAGLKYFVLGALSSGMLLYGASLVYGFAGSTSFDALATIFAEEGAEPSLGLVVGLVFVLAGLAFKVSAVPFHMWTPDVYEGAPTPVTAFFAVAPKVAAMGLLLRLAMEPFGDLVTEWSQVIVFISIASMLLGAFAALVQTNIKRLMAYSSIGHVGYALIGLAAGTEAGVQGVLIYMAIYMVMTAGAFAIILCMRQNGRSVEGIRDLSGLAKTHPMLAVAMFIFMFSMAGIPPFAGFFGKFYVFMAAVEVEMYSLAVVGVLSSVVAAYYYLRIVKVMFFDEPAEPLDRPIGTEMTGVVAITGGFTLFFFLFPGPLLTGAGAAASALFAG